jgi:hypothetical protein
MVGGRLQVVVLLLLVVVTLEMLVVGILYVGYRHLVVLIGGRLHTPALGSGHIDASRGAAASGWHQND